MVPGIIAGGVSQINMLIDTILASLLPTGSPSWLYVSDRLMQLPLGIFAIAIGTVILPRLSNLFVTDDRLSFFYYLGLVHEASFSCGHASCSWFNSPC